MKLALDWERGHGPVTGPINAAAATLTASWAGHLLDTPWPTAAAVAGAGLIGTHIAGRIRNVTRTTLHMRAAAWLGVGGWSSWAIANGPWSTWSMGTLLGGAIGLSLAVTAAHHAEAQAPAEAAAAEKAAQDEQRAAQRGALATEWSERIARVCAIPGVQIVGIEHWEQGGYTLDAELPPGGASWKDLARRADAFAADAKLPEGCGVEIAPGAHRGAAILRVATENHLQADVAYPTDYSPLTVNQPVPLGVRRDGTVYGPVNRQASMLLVGQRGSGKTNLMHVMVANQCRMTDSITWVIDLNGGGLALKWLRAWAAAGRPGRPPIDWVADTPDKALAMAEALVRIAKARKVGYQDREIAADDDKLPVDHDVPEIRVFNDEGAEIFSSRNRMDDTLKAVAGALVQTIEIARAAAVNITTSGLRATQDVIADPQILKQSTFKAAMKVADDSELNYFFGHNHGASAEDAPYPGCALVRDGGGPAHPLKIYRIKPSQIAELATVTADRRPVLDELSRRAAGEAYERRWDNTEHVFSGGQAPAAALSTADPTSVPSPAPAARATSATANWGKTRPEGVKDELAAADAAVQRLHERLREARRGDADLDAQFMDVVHGGGLAWQPPKDPAANSPAPTRDARYDTIYRIVERSGPDGISRADIRHAFEQIHPDTPAPADDVIGRWLKDDERIYKPKYGRYAVRPEEPATDTAGADDSSSPAAETSRPTAAPAVDPRLLRDAAELVITTQFASRSMLQRKLRTTWDLTGRILEQLQQHDIVGPEEPDSHTREVLVPAEQLDTALAKLPAAHPGE
ncbi:DNA translocase FtsK [Streptomyces sp. NPDC101145]|uniref:DNA translocase FtsK n=1 Tax=Streptomyces sp. NPDC101145 TaxID=3366112 RepID=UPI0038201D86